MNIRNTWNWITGKLTREQATQLTKLGAYKLGFGKNKGKTLDKIWDEDYTYFKWFLSVPTTDCKEQYKKVERFVKLKMNVSQKKINMEKKDNGSNKKISNNRIEKRTNKDKKLKEPTKRRSRAKPTRSKVSRRKAKPVKR